MHELVAILDFGSQVTQLIARRVREHGVYCEIVPHDLSPAELEKLGPKALILSGGPASVRSDDAPGLAPGVLELGLPVLGICYGLQLITRELGGEVERGGSGEYGPAVISLEDPGGLFAGLGWELKVWMSHGDRARTLPPGFKTLARTPHCAHAAIADEKRKIYGLQFHPEVVHTPRGSEILGNFLFQVAGLKGDWTMAGFIDEAVKRIRAATGDARVICALSGGVDSAVTAALLNRAVGERMTAIFVDNGVLRHGEAESIRRLFAEDYPLNLRCVDAAAEFLRALAGVTDPEQKRKAIGRVFIDVFSREARQVGGARFLAQGTLYPDVIESRSARGGPSATIKTHHNVGGLPDDLEFELIEPLKELFKDEVRALGRELGLPEKILARQPFPGPGLAVRILGEVTAANVALLQEADRRVREEMENWENYGDIWQSFAVLLPVKTVGVMGDERTYANVVALRAVTSTDGMTADWARLPAELLERISSRVINEVEGVNRVVYDISSKPPSTIEWE